MQSNRGESRAYICLFTCATTRAEHLEVVTDLTERSFLQTFRRFAGRKSFAQKMISDNASAYLSAADELKQLFKSPSLKEAFSRRHVEWHFIPKRAPWYGGFWERLIGLTKNALTKVLGRAHITLSTLQTVIMEIEAVLNDRPITYVSSEVEDNEPLTSTHLLYGRRITTLTYPWVEEDEDRDPNFMDSHELRRGGESQGLILQHFCSSWAREYLTSLREFHKTTGNNEQDVKVGEVVLVHNDGPRVKWKLAVLESLITGNDGLVRAANIRTSARKTNRPISKLYPLSADSKTLCNR